MIELSLKYCKFWHRVYMGNQNDVHTLPAQYRMKAHCPGLKGVPGTANQWMGHWIHLHMFNKCHWYWRETFETEIMDKNLHRNQWEKVYKSTESLKNVIHILGNVIQGLGHSWAPIEETTACLTGVIPEWIYCHIVLIVLIWSVTYWCTDYC